MAVFHGGVGPNAFRSSLTSLAERALRSADPSEVWINAGFCGGLNPDLQVGDLVEAPILQSGLAAAATSLFLSTAQVVSTAAEKSRLAAAYPERMAVDMESAVFAEFCRERGLRGWVVRAVSDARNQDLPVPSDLLYDVGRQRPRPAALVVFFLRHPGRVAAFWSFLIGLMRARMALADALERRISCLRAEGSAPPEAA